MNLKLKNIGIVEQADINDLTVITGDNGKCTVSKILYTLIKTIKWSSNSKRSYFKLSNNSTRCRACR